MTGIGKKIKSVTATTDQGINGLLSGTAWDGDAITYAFPTSSNHYTYSGEPRNGFGKVTALQEAAASFALDTSYGNSANNGFSVAGFTGLSISLGAASTSNLRIAQSDSPDPASAFRPSTGEKGGDVWLSRQYDLPSPQTGNYAWVTMLHEIGHALGLKHGHEAGGNKFSALPRNLDSMEYSVMTYRSHVGGSLGEFSNEEFGYAQTYMMYDIAALQHMYGANYKTNNGNTVYKWKPGSGDTLVNGHVAIDAVANRIFATIWDGGGVDTYDLSAYTTNLRIDLRPGEHSMFSKEQLSYLGGGPNDGYSRGNIFNALLHDGDLRSLIENAMGGKVTTRS